MTIDPYSEYSLYDVVDGSMPMSTVENGEVIESPTIEYMGFHITPSSSDTYIVQLDGHVGQVMQIDPVEYDDVLELVDDLNSLVVRSYELEYEDDKEALVEWAGPIMTHRTDRAEDSDLYIHVPASVEE
jgi:hypothetical protein